MITHSSFSEPAWLTLRPTAADLLEQAVGEITRTFVALVEEGREELDRQGSAPVEHPLDLLLEATRRCVERRRTTKDELAMMKRAASEDGPVE